MTRATPRLLASALLLAGVPAAWSQGVTDPTRPPPGWSPNAVAVAAAKAETVQETGSPVSILLVGQTRRFAIVRGEVIGDKTPGTRIVEIKRNDVVVQSDKGRESLNLFPDVEKTPPKKQPGMGNKDKK